ncbi:MAG: leucine-rich repeat protein [Clostridia bacterium]|nr:leucine-rich repeat protein [Clostridia bacterium]
MRPDSQIKMISLAIALAMGLALTVALICISCIKKAPTPTPTITDSQGSADFPVQAETQPTETQVPQGNGLLFSSNGDGTCVLSGIGSCTDACVVIPTYAPSGELVTAVAPMALYGCESMTALQIPASVTSIGSLAFADCKSLSYISVAAENLAYRDVEGVLYSADLSVLLLYPPMRAGTSLTLLSATTKISDMAFYRCINLSRIVYTGTAEQWESISIGSKNYSLTAAAKAFEG